jgi:acetolactate synthase I/II/III large subunit
MQNKISVADVLVRELQARGVPFISALNGYGLDPLFLACKAQGMRVIDVRNEQAASYMADVVGRLTRTVGVCAASAAVAHQNLLTGAANAMLDGAPMLLISGATPLAREGLGDFQDFDPVATAAPLCKYARKLDSPERVAQIVDEAFTAATTGRPGPVFLSLPIDIGLTPVDPTSLHRTKHPSGMVRNEGLGAPDLVAKAADLLSRAERPLAIAGSGVYYSEGEQALADFVTKHQIPTVIPIWDRGSVPDKLDAFVGVIGAASGGPPYLKSADVILALGAESDYRVGQYSPPALRDDAVVIRVHADPACLYGGVETDLSIQGSPASVLEQLTEAFQQIESQPHSDWFATARQWRDDFKSSTLKSANTADGGPTGADVVTAIGEVLTDDTVLLVDGGNIGQWFHQLLLDRYPSHWVTCGRSGVIGFGIPGALASRGLYPDKPVILLSGDGSFTFTVAELECAARQGLPFVAVVADNERWGISVTSHEKMYGEPLYSALGPTRLDKVAEGFGCIGVRAESKEDLVSALRKALTEDRPTVIQVPIAFGAPAGSIQ